MPRSKHTTDASAIPQTGVKPVKTKRRHKPGVVARREVKAQQKDTELLLKRRPFRDIVRTITRGFAKSKEYPDLQELLDGVKFGKVAMRCLQDITESYMCSILQAGKLDAEFHGKERIKGENLQYVSVLMHPDIHLRAIGLRGKQQQ